MFYLFVCFYILSAFTSKHIWEEELFSWSLCSLSTALNHLRASLKPCYRVDGIHHGCWMMDVCICEVMRGTIILKSFYLTYYLEGKQTTNDFNARTTKMQVDNKWWLPMWCHWNVPYLYLKCVPCIHVGFIWFMEKHLYNFKDNFQLTYILIKLKVSFSFFINVTNI